MSEFAADFTAIDFETANHRRDSACQLAAVKVRDGKIADSRTWMIRPKPFFFTRTNIRIHGIIPGRVADEREFGDLWDDISETLADDCLVAHNAGFDIGVLLACLLKHGKEIPDLSFTCTRVIARSTWPGRRRYGLKPLADWLGIRVRHHDAREDSIACAKVLLAAGIDKQAKSLSHLEKSLRLCRGTAGVWGHRGPSRYRRKQPGGRSPMGQPMNLPMGGRSVIGESTAGYQSSSHPPSSPLDFQRLLIRADFIRPLSGKSIVFSGKLKSFSNEEAALLASRAGGHCQVNVDSQTSILVVGSTSRTDQQQQKADQLRSSGLPIRVLSEEEFLGLVVSQT